MEHVKRFLAALTLTLLVVFSVPMPQASAHVLETDNGVSAILHLKPDDNPIAGKAVPVNLLFSNDVGGFKLNDYKVQLRLLENSTLKFSGSVQPLFFGSATEGEVMATFPSAGVYDVKVIGTPTAKDAPPFSLTFDVKVAAKATNASKTGLGGVSATIGMFSLIVLGMLAVNGIRKGGKYSRVVSEGKPKKLK